MKTMKWMIIFFMLTTYFAMDLNAKSDPGNNRTSITVEGVSLKIDEGDFVGLGLNLDFPVSARFSVGGDILLGSDLDDYTYLCFFPTVSYHFPIHSKKLDMFVGCGVDFMTVLETSEWASDALIKFFAFVGTRINFSRHFGMMSRLFVGEKGINGFSIGLMWSK